MRRSCLLIVFGLAVETRTFQEVRFVFFVCVFCFALVDYAFIIIYIMSYPLGCTCTCRPGCPRKCRKSKVGPGKPTIKGAAIANMPACCTLHFSVASLRDPVDEESTGTCVLALIIEFSSSFTFSALVFLSFTLLRVYSHSSRVCFCFFYVKLIWITCLACAVWACKVLRSELASIWPIVLEAFWDNLPRLCC